MIYIHTYTHTHTHTYTHTYIHTYIHIYIGSRQRSILRFVNVALNFHAITARIHYRTNSEAEGSQECFSCFLVHCAHSGPDFLGACRGGDAGLSAVKGWQRVGVSDKAAMTSSLKSSENYRSNLNQHLLVGIWLPTKGSRAWCIFR